MSNWYVLRCSAKGEHKALSELRAAGFDAYLPEFKVERFNRKLRKAIVTTQCLFPRYLFAQIGAHQFHEASSCKGVDGILPGYPHEPQRVAASAVEALRTAQANLDLDDTDEARRRRGETTKNTLAAMRKRLKGKRVKVIEGVFEGFPAEVSVVHSFERLQVLVDIFGRPTLVELETGQIEEMAA
jgi:transcriptional antiterminator NusG